MRVDDYGVMSSGFVMVNTPCVYQAKVLGGGVWGERGGGVPDGPPHAHMQDVRHDCCKGVQ